MKLPNEIEPFFEPLQSLQNLISRFNDRGVVIGGVAAGVLGKARFTEDLDAMLLLSTQDIPRLLEAAKHEGMEARIDDASEFARKTRVVLLRHIVTDTNIDISLGILPFEQEVVERSIMHEFESSLHVRLPTPEDLVIMKAIAHRPKDLQDIQIIAEKYPDLDKSRIEKWIKDFSEVLETPDLWNQIEEILKR